jgi:hypothetical protein
MILNFELHHQMIIESGSQEPTLDTLRTYICAVSEVILTFFSQGLSYAAQPCHSSSLKITLAVFGEEYKLSPFSAVILSFNVKFAALS